MAERSMRLDYQVTSDPALRAAAGRAVQVRAVGRLTVIGLLAAAA